MPSPLKLPKQTTIHWKGTKPTVTTDAEGSEVVTTILGSPLDGLKVSHATLEDAADGHAALVREVVDSLLKGGEPNTKGDTNDTSTGTRPAGEPTAVAKRSTNPV